MIQIGRGEGFYCSASNVCVKNRVAGEACEPCSHYPGAVSDALFCQTGICDGI